MYILMFASLYLSSSSATDWKEAGGGRRGQGLAVARLLFNVGRGDFYQEKDRADIIEKLN